jgi:hypothetical protein
MKILLPFSQVNTSCPSLMFLCLRLKQCARQSDNVLPSSPMLQTSKDLDAFPQNTRFAAANKWMP